MFVGQLSGVAGAAHTAGTVGTGTVGVGRMGWAGGFFGPVSSVTTTCRIAGAQPISAVWPAWNVGAADGTGGWLGWPDGAGPGSAVSVGVGLADAAGCVAGVWAGAVGDVGDVGEV